MNSQPLYEYLLFSLGNTCVYCRNKIGNALLTELNWKQVNSLRSIAMCVLRFKTDSFQINTIVSSWSVRLELFSFCRLRSIRKAEQLNSSCLERCFVCSLNNFRLCCSVVLLLLPFRLCQLPEWRKHKIRHVLATTNALDPQLDIQFCRHFTLMIALNWILFDKQLIWLFIQPQKSNMSVYNTWTHFTWWLRIWDNSTCDGTNRNTYTFRYSTSMAFQLELLVRAKAYFRKLFSRSVVIAIGLENKIKPK